jgi:AraC-like DNA-binding protein
VSALTAFDRCSINSQPSKRILPFPPRRNPINSPAGVLLDKRVEKILQMMRDDVHGELSLAEFAQSVNLSIWRLSHIFKSDVGMPPIKYLRLLRMERAKGLLESSFLSVKEIAYQVGVNDESHFVRDFKTTYGYSPAIYRSHFRHNGNANVNGHSNGDSVEVDPVQAAEQASKLRQQLTQIAKQSIVPSLHLFAYFISCLDCWS